MNLSSSISQFFYQLPANLFIETWAWWAAGLGLGLTAVALAWFTGKRLGVTGGFEDACSILAGEKSNSGGWKIWFILGLPLGGLIANAGHWDWTLLYGRLDALTYGIFYWKALWLLISGFLIGYGARWAGGCTSGNSIMGIAIGSLMSVLATLAFLASGILLTNILFRAVM